MRRIFLGLASVLTCCILWGASVFATLDQGWGNSAIADTGDARGFVEAARDIAEQRNAGNVSFILIEGGTPVGDFHLSTDERIDGRTVFQVASLGKWLTAWGVMALVEDGEIDLDAPVSTYLSRWQLPASEFDASGVTVRRLLSHTAGLTDSLGYDGFDRAQDRQTLEASLTTAGDASPGNDGRTILGSEPGTAWNYSGGSYTLLQLVIEEVSGTSFAEFMQARVFEPLAMDRTTFDHDAAIELGLAQNFLPDGSAQPFRWYTALAATSLFTTSEDLARFISAQTPGVANAVLSAETMALMRQPHASEMGADIWGLGTMLYAPNNAGDFIIGHDGSNEPAINTAARLDPATGDGIVILSTGNPMLATEIAGEWVFWKTGNVDSLTFASRLPTALTVFAVGVIAILLFSALLFWKQRRTSATPT
ncbi:serine hydrolase domain-containing protein [Parasphingopyxis marina]|uniref:Beta-lactamase family protein n=1 Tax=Parasphingopyxis marina TaxID=2761622 RepID=A0A842HWQ7_9SPHN|nr:serine hydrolase domain-containing protein [Parasphingopyxis marina]MBC2776719.1 beta-lactamase family protein [Parasphingopyxis marina]